MSRPLVHWRVCHVPDLVIQTSQIHDSYCGSRCTDNFCGPRRTKPSINWYVWFICNAHHKTISTYPVEMNTKLAATYYNMEKPGLFRMRVDVTQSLLKERLDKINGRLCHGDTRRVKNVKYCCHLIDSDGSVWFIQMKLRRVLYIWLV